MSENNVLLDEWTSTIWKCLGSPKDKDACDKAHSLALTLLRVIPTINKSSDISFPYNNEVSDTQKKTQKLVDILDELSELSKKSEYFRSITNFVTSVKQGRLDFIDVHWFCIAMNDMLLDDKVGLKGGPNNKRALEICCTICRLYKRIWGKKPGCYDMDRITQSGDEKDGTPYERICSAVEKQFSISIPWSTRKQALKAYQLTRQPKRLYDKEVDEIPPK